MYHLFIVEAISQSCIAMLLVFTLFWLYVFINLIEIGDCTRKTNCS